VKEERSDECAISVKEEQFAAGAIIFSLSWVKRAGRTEHEIKQQREGNIHTAELKLRLMLNMLDTHEFIEKLQAAGLSRTLQSFPRFLEFY